MRIAIASEGREMKDRISNKGGRAPYYLLFEDGKLVETFKNHFSVGGGGAGFSVAKVLEQKSVEKVIGRKFGDNMKGALEERSIIYEETDKGMIEEVVHS